MFVQRHPERVVGAVVGRHRDPTDSIGRQSVAHRRERRTSVVGSQHVPGAVAREHRGLRTARCCECVDRGLEPGAHLTPGGAAIVGDPDVTDVVTCDGSSGGRDERDGRYLSEPRDRSPRSASVGGPEEAGDRSGRQHEIRRLRRDRDRDDVARATDSGGRTKRRPAVVGAKHSADAGRDVAGGSVPSARSRPEQPTHPLRARAGRPRTSGFHRYAVFSDTNSRLAATTYTEPSR